MKFQKLTFAFDLDNTFCQAVREGHPEDCSKVKVNKRFIKIIRDLKTEKHEVIFFTGRDENVFGKETKKWLAQLNIPYDRIIFNKPHYDFFIDDRADTPNQHLTAKVLLTKAQHIWEERQRNRI